MAGLADHIENVIQNQRMREIYLGKSFRWMIVFLNVIGNYSKGCISLRLTNSSKHSAVLCTSDHIRGFCHQIEYNWFWNTFNITSVYLACSDLLDHESSNTLLASFPAVTAAIACFDRIQAFLASKPVGATVMRSSDSSYATSGTSSDVKLVDMSQTIRKASSEQLSAVIKDACIPARIDGAAVLHDINVKFPRNSVTSIIGPVGSGKSTLLKPYWEKRSV